MQKKTLVIVRHAKSSWSDASLSDRERPLNKRGKRDAPFMGTLLHNRGLIPGVLISSAAVRAAATASLLARELAYPEERIRIEPRLYESGIKEYIDVLRAVPDAIPLAMIVGHNPTVTDLSDFLCAAGIQNIPTCGVVIIDLAVPSWSDLGAGTGSFVEFEYPKKYLSHHE